MDDQRQPNSTAPDEHERVPITDYPGAPNVPPLTMQPAQREIKQVEDREIEMPQGGQHSPIGWLDRRIPHFAFAIEDGRLTLTRSKWWSLLGRVAWIVWYIIWIVTSSQQVTSSSNIIFHTVITLGWVIISAFYLISVISFVRGKGDQLIFDLATNTFTRSQYSKMQPTHLSDIREVNVDQQSSEYSVSLRLATGGKIKIDTWYNEAEALYAGGVIAEYLSVPVTRIESPASVASGCAFTIAVFLVLFLVIALVLWVGITFFHLSQST